MSLKASLDHPYLQPRNEKPRIHYFTPEGVAARSYGFIKAALPIKSIAGVGGLFGSLLGYIVVTYNLHRAYLATPLVFVLVPYVAPFLSSMFGLCENRYMKGVMSGVWSAQLPGGEEDENGRVQSPPMGLFLIGARCNKPLGMFDKRFAAIGKQFTEMWKELEADPDSGLLHVEGFMGLDQERNGKYLNLAYFKSVDDVLRYSQGPRHRKAWSDYMSHSLEENQYYEIWHELVQVQEGGSEAIYGNFRPHGLAAAFMKMSPEEKDQEREQWQSVMAPISAKTKTSKSRMGRE